MKTKLLKSLLALILAVVTAFSTAMTVFADTSVLNTDNKGNVQSVGENETPPLYVKDVMVSNDSDINKAKSNLTDKGYALVDQDLKTGMGGDFVYMGYKTTTNKNEAITDISVMNMNGGYSIKDYRALAEQNSDNITEVANQMKDLCQLVGENVDAKSTNAVNAKKMLDLLQYSKSDSTKLGDYLLSTKRTTNDYREIIIKANGAVISYIFNQLVAGVTDVNETWMKRLSDFKQEKLTKDQSIQQDKLYKDKAQDLYHILKDYADNCEDALQRQKDNDGKVELPNVNNEKEFVDEVNSFNNSSKIDEKDGDALYIGTYNILSKYKYKDSNLGDFFLTVNDDNFSYKSLYPLVMEEILSKGQYSALRYNGLVNLVTATAKLDEVGIKNPTIKDNDFNKSYEKVKSMFKDVQEDENQVLNLWSGATPELFDNLVGQTDAQIRADNAMDVDQKINESQILSDNMLFALYAGGIVLATSLGIVVIVGSISGFIVGATATGVASFVAVGAVALCTSATVSTCALAGAIAGVYIPIAGVVIAAAALLVVAAIWVVDWASDLWDYYHPKYKQIPDYMVDNVKNKTVIYNAVLNQNNVPCDVNAWQGLQWNAIYTTKDKNAGSPIMADENGVIFTTQTKWENLKDSSSVHWFGEVYGANLNTYEYSESKKSVYIHYHTQNTLSKDTTEDDNKEKYVCDIKIASKSSMQASYASLVNQGYYVIYKELYSSGDEVSLLGFKITTQKNDAITDIRVAQKDEYMLPDPFNYGSSKYAKCGEFGEIGVYYTKGVNAGTPILPEFKIENEFLNDKDGYEPVNSFSGGNAFNLEVAGDLNTVSNELSKGKNMCSYLYFMPSKTYTSGTEYVSGVTFLNGPSLDYYSLDDYAKYLGLDKNSSVVFDDKLFKTLDNGKNESRIYVTKTYNPYRAVTSIKTYSAQSNNLFCQINKPIQITYLDPNSSSKRKKYITENVNCGYSTCSVFKQIKPDIPGSWELVHQTDKSNAFKFDTDYSTAAIEAKSYKKSVGLYVAGPTKSIDPLKVDDIEFTNDDTVKNGNIFVTDFTDEFNDSKCNLTSNSKSPCYLSYKGKAKAKGKYIKSVEICYINSPVAAKDQAIIRLLSSTTATDEIIDFNFSTCATSTDKVINKVTLDDSYNANFTPSGGTGNKNIKFKGTTNENAYIRVSRTDKASDAITNFMIYSEYSNSLNESYSRKSYVINDSNYYKVGNIKSLTGFMYAGVSNFSLYYSKSPSAGEPVSDIAINIVPLSQPNTRCAIDEQGKIDRKLGWKLSAVHREEDNFTYITNVCLSDFTDKDGDLTVLTKLANLGCTGVEKVKSSNSNKWCYIGYSRSMYKEDGISAIRFSTDNDSEKIVNKINKDDCYKLINNSSNQGVSESNKTYLYVCHDTDNYSAITDMVVDNQFTHKTDNVVWNTATDFGGDMVDLTLGIKKPTTANAVSGIFGSIFTKNSINGSLSVNRSYLHYKLEDEDTSQYNNASIFSNSPKLIAVLIMALIIVAISATLIIYKRKKK